MKIKNALRSGLILALLLGMFCQPVLADGYSATTRWWTEVKATANTYTPYLQGIFSEVEGKTLDKQGLYQQFCEELKRRHPGSTCYNTPGGSMAINGYTSVVYDTNWNISSLTQTFGSLRKVYYFDLGSYDPRRNSMEITEGPNKVAFRLEPGPYQYQFTQVTIPAISATVNGLLASRRPAPANYTGNAGVLLSDVYQRKIAPSEEIRMDEAAERFIQDQSFRDWVLAEAQAIYARPLKTTAPAAARKYAPNYKATPVEDAFISVVGRFLLGLGFLLIFPIALMGLTIWALIDLISSNLDSGTKTFWAIVIVLFTPLGMVLYFIYGAKKKKEQRLSLAEGPSDFHYQQTDEFSMGEVPLTQENSSRKL